MEPSVFSSPAYRRSRRAYSWECAFEYLVALLVADSFLAKLLTQLGFSDAQTGLISSFISLAFLFQLMAVPLVRRIANVKRFSAAFHAVSQLLFMSLYLVPFLPMSPAARRVAAVLCMLGAYFGNYLVSTLIYRWGNSFVEPHERAFYSANKEILSLTVAMLGTLATGYALDRFDMAGDLYGGFAFVAAAIFIFSLCDFTCLMLIKNEARPPREEQVPVREVVGTLFGNRSFVYVVLLTILWDVARYMSLGFLGTFKLNDLLFTVGQVQLFNLVGNLIRVAVSRPFGRYSDKRSFAGGVELALVIAMAAFGVNIFATRATRWLIVLHTLLYHVCLAGIEANLFNITYSYVDSAVIVQANAIKNSIGGLCGFMASVVGSWILTRVQENGNQLLGVAVYGQQLLAVITVVILLLAFLLTHFVIRKQKVLVQ